MRSYDQRQDRPSCESFAIPLGGYGPGGWPRVHFPDVLLVLPDGDRVALELELTLKSRRRLEAILGGYAADPRIARVIYETDSPKVARALQETGRIFGLDERMAVHYLEQGAGWHTRPPAQIPSPGHSDDEQPAR
jgi:hypothetical protein